MNITNLLYNILNNVTCKVSINFYLEGDEYTISLNYSTKFDYECYAERYSTDVHERYKSANVIEFWSPKKVIKMYIDESKNHFYTFNVLRNGAPIRLYDRSRLFFSNEKQG